MLCCFLSLLPEVPLDDKESNKQGKGKGTRPCRFKKHVQNMFMLRTVSVPVCSLTGNRGRGRGTDNVGEKGWSE